MKSNDPYKMSSNDPPKMNSSLPQEPWLNEVYATPNCPIYSSPIPIGECYTQNDHLSTDHVETITTHIEETQYTTVNPPPIIPISIPPAVPAVPVVPAVPAVPAVPTPALPALPTTVSVIPPPTLSVFPPIEPPVGSLVSIFLEDNSHHQKRNRRLGGAGLATVGIVATGGLLILPLAAGFAVNKLVKKHNEKCIYAYSNTYVYEIRSVIAHNLGIAPEYLQLKRNSVMLIDTMYISHYFAYPGKNRIHITMHIKDTPVVGSVCSVPGQYEYPISPNIDCSSYSFSLLYICFNTI